VSWLVPPRRPGRELLDDPSLAPREMAKNLAELSRIDRAWGGSRALARWLAARSGGLGRVLILDLGAGSGVAAGRLSRELSAAGLAPSVIALDLQWRHLASGREGRGRSAAALAADALRLPLRDGSVDFAVSALLLHHLSPQELATLFCEIRRVARRGFALLDLRRHRVPLAFLAAAGRLLFESTVTRHDALVSVRQAYTPEELGQILAEAVPRARVERVFPYRLLVAFAGDSAGSVH
jgi:SAM-dependent methyltransferase